MTEVCASRKDEWGKERGKWGEKREKDKKNGIPTLAITAQRERR